ncbi:MAG: AAA family ATPase [Pseudomonadota bacterium]|jgi:MoxR-like ATPase
MEAAVTQIEFHKAHITISAIITALEKIIRGRGDTIRLVVAALVADGHVLLEDYPGSGKTTLSKTLGGLIGADSSDTSRYPSRASDPIVSFRRIQFTPDMLPGDVLGVNIFDPKTGQFSFMHGPVFAHIVLADEINRTGPKVQAAFLECMAEKQVTMDNVTRPLDQLFFVLGTQNPLDIAGTYPLPQVQLDRFLLKVPMSYVDAATECAILESHSEIREGSTSTTPVCSRSDVLDARRACDQVHITPALREAMVEIVQATRGNPMIQFGASTRAALMLQTATRAWALIQGRDHANEDDLRYIAPYVLLHRLKFHAGAGESKRALEAIMEPALESLVRRGL